MGSSKTEGAAPKGRYAIPFFSEPGLGCLIKMFDGGEIVYGHHVLETMEAGLSSQTWLWNA